MSDAPGTPRMRGNAASAVMLVVCLFSGICAVSAETWVKPSGGADECAAPRYVTLDPSQVLSAAHVLQEGASFAVRFTDALEGKRDGASADGPDFVTRCGIRCGTAEVGTLDGLESGQSLTIEGELRGGGGYVRVHRILRSSGGRSRIERELVLRPQGSVPRLVDGLEQRGAQVEVIYVPELLEGKFGLGECFYNQEAVTLLVRPGN